MPDGVQNDTPSVPVLLAELEALSLTVRAARAEIASLRADHDPTLLVPGATDELDAVIRHTAEATDQILDSCEALERLQPSLVGPPAETVGDCVTRIYEACSFQDITGQRIRKVVQALKTVEERVALAMDRYGAAVSGTLVQPMSARSTAAVSEGEKLANGPQLPGAASSQADIDALLASFD